MKKSTLCIAFALVSWSAFAQGPIATAGGTLPAAKPTVASEPPAGELAGVNPFTGRPLQLEQVQRELEGSKLRTQLLEEMLKQTNLREETNTVPLRKAVEAAQAKASIKKEELNSITLEESAKAARAAQAAQLKALTALPGKPRASKGARAKAVPAAKVEAAAPRAPVAPRAPTLQSVLDVAGARSVVLDFSGATLVVPDGGMTPAGEVRILDANTANIGGRPYRVHSATLSRFVTSDTKPEEPATVGVTAAGVASGAVAVNNALMAGSKAAALPQLQLPPGLPPLPLTLGR